jgi:hypothetical protein
MGKKYRGGEFFQGDYGCVVHPSLAENSDVNTTVTKVFKEPIEKAREDKIYSDILDKFPNDFIVKKINDTVDPSKNPEINDCKLPSGPITAEYIKKNSISYEYLGKSYEDTFFSEKSEPITPPPGETNTTLAWKYIRALVELSFKMIEMNNKGISHNDVASRNVTYKDGKAYLIDVGAFEYKPGTINYKDVADVIQIIYNIVDAGELISDEDDLTILRSYTASYGGVNSKNIEEVKAFLTKILPKGGKRRKTRRRSKQRKTHRRRR